VLQWFGRNVGVKDACQVTLIRSILAGGFTIDRKVAEYLNWTLLKKV
jgi:hypothetical protein